MSQYCNIDFCRRVGPETVRNAVWYTTGMPVAWLVWLPNKNRRIKRIKVNVLFKQMLLSGEVFAIDSFV